jgi:hypothetical protein
MMAKAKKEITSKAIIVAWAAAHETTRSEAIRRLVELGLKAKK